LPVIVGYQPHVGCQSILQRLVADRLESLNPYRGDVIEFNRREPPTAASIRRVLTRQP
jgi:hypothetical protein